MPRSAPTLALLASLAAGAPTLRSQIPGRDPGPDPTPLGTVQVAAATVSGTLSLADGNAALGPNTIITAHDRTASVMLARGGEVLVCATSALHATRGSDGPEPNPLLFALDRGAVEIHMAATSEDAILTPDLRFSLPPHTGGLLDLRLRVAANGDTCVESRGAAGPTLHVAEQFGSEVYQVRPGQHVMFEHGSLREVVDDETSPCGCPPPPVLSAANSGISVDATEAARPHARVADDPDEIRPNEAAAFLYPFPAAESQGLSLSSDNPASAIPEASPGQKHAQIAATLAFPGGLITPDTPETTRGVPVATPANSPAASADPPASAPAPANPAANTAATNGTATATLQPPGDLAVPATTEAAAPAQKDPGASASPSADRSAPAPELSVSSAPAPSNPTPSHPVPSPAVPSDPAQPAASTRAAATIAATSPPQPSAPEHNASASTNATSDSLSSHEVAEAPLPPAAPGARTIFRKLGHFFHGIFIGQPVTP